MVGTGIRRGSEYRERGSGKGDEVEEGFDSRRVSAGGDGRFGLLWVHVGLGPRYVCGVMM